MIRLRNSKKHVYEFIERYIARNGEAPTIDEIRKHFDWRSPASVHEILVKLECQGLIRRTPNISRGIQIARPVTPTVGWLDR